MRLNKLDLNLIVVLDALLTEVSIKHAASKLFLSPSATSNALARLRDFFEDDLLQQMGKTMVLTPKAISLQKPVRDLLLQVQTITRTSAEFDPKSSDRRIVIEAFDVTMHVFLDDVVRHLMQEAPQMQFDLRLMDPGYQASLESGKTDLLIVPKAFTVPDHAAEPLYSDDWSCITWTDNDLPSEPTLDEYLSLEHAAIQWHDSKFKSHKEQALTQQGYTRRPKVTAPGFTLLYPFLIGTRLVATVPTLLARKLASYLPLRVLACPLSMPRIVQQIQWRRYHEHDPAICWVRDVMHRRAAAMAVR